ncbi:hypothetical protein [Pedobacter sp. MC2016-24]|jgi:hypothetical protein|uniref:hypothetical protein n=1 Tax=Pedobacter sp. MC2016-24 TaxID=2780090 RepID=UPI001882E357|nr:hypothetical protein [Pedobacter sp. MC2016-24]MBE9602294.1 hypothetical protein [Pedobacter sp. MC2016-24]
MSDYSELILANKNSGRTKDLEDALNGVEVTYARWLGNRVNIHTGEKPDRLGNYFRCFYNETGIQFYVKDGLPTDITNACWSAFRSIFDNKG